MKKEQQFEAFVNQQIEEIEEFFNDLEFEPQFYYEWGNEPYDKDDNRKVSTGAYDKNDVYHFTGYYNKSIKNTLPFHNPHS